MRSADGTTCPMHRGGNRDTAGERPGDRCAMRGTCDGPMAAMVALLSQNGPLAASASLTPPDLDAAAFPVSVREHLLGRLAPPDPPPPRG
jgi:hypothetical protein